MAINQKSYDYGAAKSSIREIAAYGAARKAQIGADNVYDFSLGNPSVPAPDAVRASIVRNAALPASQLTATRRPPACLRRARRSRRRSTAGSTRRTSRATCTSPAARPRPSASRCTRS